MKIFNLFRVYYRTQAHWFYWKWNEISNKQKTCWFLLCNNLERTYTLLVLEQWHHHTN